MQKFLPKQLINIMKILKPPLPSILIRKIKALFCKKCYIKALGTRIFTELFYFVRPNFAYSKCLPHNSLGHGKL